MILAIDIGNTNVTLGLFENDSPSFSARLSSDTKKPSDEYAILIKGLLSLHSIGTEKIDGAIISSVVPPLTSVIKEALKLIFGCDALTVGPGIKTGININCDIPSSVGTDLICSCVAVHHLYESPALIIDMGTATKIMSVNEKGAFTGVSILPGVIMGLTALAEGTAQLPRVSLETPRAIISKNTADCMKSGAIYGNASMIDGMIDRINAETGAELPVYATGGLAPVIIPHCKHNIKLDVDLVLKGLNILYKKNS